uniref:Reticulocalbin-3 n=1 Tax=Schistocephalus solidus TaxID=70667 RepID=A0A0X3PLL3_SCHSO
MAAFSTLLVLSFISISWAKPHDPKGRAYDKELSQAVHQDNDVHDVGYDHDAFLGKDEAQKFSHMTPEQSRQKLGEIVEKMDTDADGYVTYNELTAWLKKISNKYIDEDVDRTFEEYKSEFKTDQITFAQHKTKLTDDFDDEVDVEGQAPDLLKAIERDQKRFNKADLDGDGKLNRDEFAAFLHPEEFERMREIVVEETIQDLDTNEDGVIDLEEYTNDMWDNSDGSQMPDWVKTERQQFHEVRDKNRDGFLDREEVTDWLFPSDYNHIDSEAKHLIAEADDDKDGKLSKREIVSHYDLFVGSQATDFGQALRPHEEL